MWDTLEDCLTSMALEWIFAFVVFGLSAPILAVELDILRYRVVIGMHPRTTFISCLFLILFFFMLGFIVNKFELPRAAGIATFACMTVVWGVYVHFRTRHMWPAE